MHPHFFKKGTSKADGIGIFAALIKYFENLESAPKLVIATHFHEAIHLLSKGAAARQDIQSNIGNIFIKQ